MIGLLRLLVEINVLLVVAYVLAHAGAGWSWRHRLRFAQALFALAFVFPLAARAVPHGALPLPTVQVWSGDTLGSGTGGSWSHIAPAARLGGRPSFDVGLLVEVALALAAAVAVGRLSWLAWRVVRLRRSLEALPSIRRLGRVAVVAARDGAVPFSAWLFGRAYVVVPESLLVDGGRYAIAVRHELAHHRHRDTLWVHLFEIGRALAWWNPVSHRWARRFTELMELACDEALIQRRKVDALAYSRCLLEIARSVVTAEVATTGMAGMTHESFLKRRIEMLLAPRTFGRRAAVVIPLAATLALAAAAFAVEGPGKHRALGLEEARALAARALAPDFPVVMNDRVLDRLNRLVGTPEGRAFLAGALARMPEHRPGIERQLAEAGMPASLVAVVLVESGFRNNAGLPTEPTIAPGQRGAGLWMFIPQTAMRYGLTVDPERGIDERLDVPKETDAAIAYLGDLHRQFRDWHLALAAYNEGERHVAQAIAEGGARNAFVLAEQGRLNDYVATVMAGAVVLANPEILD